MRSRRSLLSLVLAATLLAGQWLAAAHGPEHELQPGAAHTCAVCIYAHGVGTGALPVAPQVILTGGSAAPAAPVADRPLASTLRHHPIRGPPALLA